MADTEASYVVALAAAQKVRSDVLAESAHTGHSALPMGLFGRKKSPLGDQPSEPVDPWAIYETLSAKDWSSLSEPARQLVAFGELRTEVNNGGFHQYFFNSGGDLAREALQASGDLSLESLHALIQQALDLLQGRYTNDREARQNVLDQLDNESEFEPLDAAFYAIEESIDLDAAMAALAASA
jgi:hypothetical protein